MRRVIIIVAAEVRMARLIKGLDTKLIHAGEPDADRRRGLMPIFQSSTYEYAGQTNYHDLRYIRLNNTPNHAVLHAKLAALEGAEAALVAGSGMAAMSTTLITVLAGGGHLLAQDCCTAAPDLFVESSPPRDRRWISSMATSPPRGAKPTSQHQGHLRRDDVESAAAGERLAGGGRFAAENGLVSMIDNTFASPINFWPAEIGFDLSIHSGTKYLNGHTDIVAGVVIGRADSSKSIAHTLNHLGGTLDRRASCCIAG